MTRSASGTRVLLARHLAHSGPGLLLALVAFVTGLALVGGSRLTNHAVDTALGAQLASSPVVESDLVLRREPAVNSFQAREFRNVDAEDTATVPDPFDEVTAAALDILGDRFSALLDSATHRAEASPAEASPASARTSLDVEAPQLVLVLQSGLGERVTWTRGRAPRRTSETVRFAEQPGARRTSRPLLEVALADDTARLWGLHVGDRLRLTPPSSGDDRPSEVELVGTYAARDTGDPFWARDRMLLRMASIPTDDGGAVRRADAVVAPDAYSDLVNALTPMPSSIPASTGPPWGTLTQSWDFRLDEGRLRAADVEPLRAGIGRLDTSRGELTPSAPYPRVTTGLTRGFETFERNVAVTQSILSIVAAAVLVLSALVLALTAHVLLERRQHALRLLRSRGASLPQLWRLVGLEVLVWTTPAVLAGAATGLLVPGRVGTTAMVGVVLTVLAPTATALVSTRASVRTLTVSRQLARGEGGVPRITAEVLILVLAGLAAATAAERGSQVSSGRADPVVSIAPVLLALAVGVLVARLHPIPVRWVAAMAARGRGTVGFLGMARAARERAVALVPLVALLLATSTAVLMATVTTSADAERTITSWRAVGADARVDGQRIDRSDVDRLEADPAVDGVVTAHRTGTATLLDESGSSGRLVTLLGVDPQRYAALLADTPLAFDPSPLTRQGSAAGDTEASEGGPVPALLSADVPGLGGHPHVATGGRSIPLDVVGTRPTLRRGGDVEELVVLVRLDTLQSIDPTAQPNTAYVGLVPGTTLAGDVIDSPLIESVTTRVTWLHDVTDQPLPTLVRQVFAGGALVAAVDSVIAVLLLLALTAPGRRQALVRLRTMGLPRGHERRLVAYELLPLVLAAVVPGLALGLVLPAAVHDVLDLAAFTGGPPYPPVSADPLWIAGLVAAVLAVVLVGLGADAARARHAGLAQSLRQGDQA